MDQFSERLSRMALLIGGAVRIVVSASGLVKLFFNNESAACRSASPKELMTCSFVGLADGDGAGDLAPAGPIVGDGDWP